MPVDPLLQGLVAGFVAEADELCQKATRAILGLERPASPEAAAAAVDGLARGLHTLKGSAATLGLGDLADLAHAMEDAVAPVRKAPGPLSGGQVDALLAGLDSFTHRLAAHASGAEPAPLGEILARLVQAAGLPAAPAPAAPVPAAPAPPAPETALPEQLDSWRVDTGQIEELVREVERLRELGLRLEERRRELGRVVDELERGRLAADAADARLGLRASGSALQGDIEEAGDIVGALEERLKAICTLPVRTVLDPLQRTVRDLCRNLGKRASLSVVGAEVALDRRLLETLKAPLIQLVRNAVDHGLEPPEVRERAGKHGEGALVIRVEQVGNTAFLELSDDGRGLDTAAIREEALRRGLLPPEELARMTPAQVHQLVFRSGFSTRAEVSETSGRGVGLDVVRERLERHQGRVEVQSVDGQGSRFVLSLPAQLGSSPLLLVKAAGHTLALPTLAVEAVVAARAERLREGGGWLQLVHEEALVGLQDLGARLRLREASAPSEGRPILVLRAQARQLALVVDEVIGERELVVRPLPPELAAIPAFGGAATLARGELVLTLRPDWLVELGPLDQLARGSIRRALVVDDSLTARALHRTVLESGGWLVHLAGSARQALEHLGRAAYDVMVCDVGMEEMDGLALTAEVRRRAETRAMPVVLVSAHDAPAERARGLAAGADGFLSKKDCVSGRLLAEVAAAVDARRGGGR